MSDDKENSEVPKMPEPNITYEDGRKVNMPRCTKCRNYPGALRDLGPVSAGKCQYCMNAVVVRNGSY